MVTREEFQLYLAAKRRDFGGLADMLRSGAELSQEVRNLLADILQGKIKNPKHRPFDPDKVIQHLGLAHRFRQLKIDRPTKNARKDAAKEFKVSERIITTAMQKLREFEKRFGPYDPDPLRELKELQRQHQKKENK